MNIYTRANIEKASGVSFSRIKYAIERGRLPEPRQINRARVWDDAGIAEIKAFFADVKPYTHFKNINKKEGE